MLTFAEARDRVNAQLAKQPNGEIWSTDFDTSNDLVTYLARTGRDGTYSEGFEDLSDPYALHVPGSVNRTVNAIIDAADNLGMPIAVEKRPGRAPIYGLGGAHALAGLMDARGITLALLSEYVRLNIDVPPEFQYASVRASSSGTHMSGVSHALAKRLTARG
ncbi:hypothetical protein [Nocardiopsis nanhaiensis]